MAQLNEAGLKQREKMIADMIARRGKAKVEAWLSDPEKLSIINAMAQSFADN